MTDDPDAKPKSRWLFRLCVTLGVIGCTIGLCTGLFFLSAPMMRANIDHLNMQGTTKQLGIGIHGCHDANNGLLGPFDDRGGTMTDYPKDPLRRLSWRAAVLPYVEHEHVYKQLDLTQAWDSPANTAASATRIRAFGDPIDANGYSTHTPYRVFYDNGALWDSDPKRRVSLDKIPDGAANTILVVESTVQVPWAQFNEHPYDPTGPLPELGRTGRNTFLACMADGSVRVVKKSVSPNTLRSAITREGGDEVGPDW